MQAKTVGGIVIAIGVLAIIGSMLPDNNSSDSDSQPSYSLNGSEVAATPEPQVADPATIQKLKEQIHALDRKGQRIVESVLPHMEKYYTSGSDRSREKIEEAVGACRGVAEELHEVSSAHMGAVSILDTVPGEDRPKSAERSCAEAALLFAQGYEFSAESFDKFLGFMEGPPDLKRLRKAKEDLDTANGQRLQGLAALATVD